MRHTAKQNSTSGFYIFADDATAFGTGKAGLTIAVDLSKAGAAFSSVAPTVTDRGDGVYWVAPIAAHRNTFGEIAWKFTATNAVIEPRFERVVAVDDQAERFGAVAPAVVAAVAIDAKAAAGNTMPAT